MSTENQQEQPKEPSQDDMKDFEKNFMGMFENMAKQLENIDDDDDEGLGDAEMPDEESLKQAEKMM